MDSLAAGHDAAVQMIDTSIVRVHQHGPVSRTTITKIWVARVGARPARFTRWWTPMACRSVLPSRRVKRTTIGFVRFSSAPCFPKTILLADRGYDADWIRELARQQGAWANIPPKRNRKDPFCFSPYLYRARNLIERFFNKIKQCRRVATRYDKLAANYLAFVKLASIRRTVVKRQKRARPKMPGFALSWENQRSP